MSKVVDQLAESRSIARMLMLAAERARVDFADAVAPFDIPVPLARALLVLADPTPMRDLAAHLACDPSYVTGLADQLEGGGLVSRMPGKDRRVKLLVATSEGAALRDRIAAALASRSRLEQRLTPPQRETLVDLLQVLLGPAAHDALVQDQGDGGPHHDTRGKESR